MTPGPPVASSSSAFAEGEVILLRRKEGDSFLLVLRTGPQPLEGRGVLDATPIIGQPPGAVLDWAGARYRAFRPSLADMLLVLRRRAQIVTPKDAQFLLYLAGIGPGARVAEAGAGSGALTTVLAFAVGPSGAVVTFDRREEFLEVAQRNVRSSGLAERVTFRVRDVAADGIDLTDQDAIVLDLPEPWSVLPSAKRALVPGGRIATYTPTYNQLERTVRELRALGFEEVRSVELLERTLHVGDGGTRPEFDMLGHTGFLTGARKVD